MGEQGLGFDVTTPGLGYMEVERWLLESGDIGKRRFGGIKVGLVEGTEGLRVEFGSDGMKGSKVADPLVKSIQGGGGETIVGRNRDSLVEKLMSWFGFVVIKVEVG